MDFSAGQKVARYTFTNPCADLPQPIAVTQGDNPTLDSSQLDQSSIYMAFDDHARALARYVGSNTFQATLSCDGKVLETQTIEPITRVCRA